MKKHPITCIYGDDEYQVASAARAVVDALVPEESRVFGLETIDAQADNVEHARQIVGQVIEALQTVSLFGDERLIWMKDANMLNDSVVGRSAAVKELVNELAALIKDGLQDNVRLLVTSPKVDKRYAFYKACKAAGELKDFVMPEKSHKADDHARGFLSEMLGQTGLKMNGQVRDLFVEKVGTDTRQIANEVEKLAVYVNRKGDVTLEDIETIVSVSRESLSWDFADAIASRDLQRSLTVLRQLMFQGESPMGLIVGLENRFRDLLMLRHAMHQRWLRLSGGKWKKAEWDLDADMSELLEACEDDPRKIHPFRLSLLAEQAKSFTRREIVQAQKLVFQAHRDLVSNSLPNEMLLEILVLKLFRAGRT